MNHICLFKETGERYATIKRGIHFNTDSEKTSYIEKLQKEATDNGYTGILTAIEITTDELNYYLGNKGQGDNGTGYIRDMETGKPVSAPARIITKTEQANTEKLLCEADLKAIDEAIQIAKNNNDTEYVEELQKERENRINEYAEKLEEINNA